MVAPRGFAAVDTNAKLTQPDEWRIENVSVIQTGGLPILTTVTVVHDKPREQRGAVKKQRVYDDHNEPAGAGERLKEHSITPTCTLFDWRRVASRRELHATSRESSLSIRS